MPLPETGVRRNGRVREKKPVYGIWQLGRPSRTLARYEMPEAEHWLYLGVHGGLRADVVGAVWFYPRTGSERTIFWRSRILYPQQPRRMGIRYSRCEKYMDSGWAGLRGNRATSDALQRGRWPVDRQRAPHT